MSFAPLPASLPHLTPTEAVADAVYRFTSGLDTADPALFESSFTPDAVFTLGDRVMSGRDAIRTGSYDRVSKLDTLHKISNVRVLHIDDGPTATATAKLTATAVSHHYRAGEGLTPGAPTYVSGALYFVDLVRDDAAEGAGGDGLWRIKDFKYKPIFSEGDRAVMSG